MPSKIASLSPRYLHEAPFRLAFFGSAHSTASRASFRGRNTLLDRVNNKQTKFLAFLRPAVAHGDVCRAKINTSCNGYDQKGNRRSSFWRRWPSIARLVLSRVGKSRVGICIFRKVNRCLHPSSRVEFLIYRGADDFSKSFQFEHGTANCFYICIMLTGPIHFSAGVSFSLEILRWSSRGLFVICLFWVAWLLETVLMGIWSQLLAGTNANCCRHSLPSCEILNIWTT